jgi:hypothetical protein
MQNQSIKSASLDSKPEDDGPQGFKISLESFSFIILHEAAERRNLASRKQNHNQGFNRPRDLQEKLPFDSTPCAGSLDKPQEELQQTKLQPKVRAVYNTNLPNIIDPLHNSSYPTARKKLL